MVGLATDFCVNYSAVDAARLGYPVTVLRDLCRGIDLDGSFELALKDMRDAGSRLPDGLPEEIRACRICAERFAATHTAHEPRPVVWFRPGARILIAGQAPGLRVHKSGRPFDDPSGDRLRDWLGMSSEEFYDRIALRLYRWRSVSRDMMPRGRTCHRPRSAVGHGMTGSWRHWATCGFG